MRILAVAPYYAPEGGGLERYAHAILGRLVARGHDVTALSFTRDGLPSDDSDGVHVRRSRPAFFLGNSPIQPAFAADVAGHIRHHRPDVVLAHTPVPFPAEMAFRAARREGVPFVVTYHAGALRGSSRMLAGLAALHRATFERGMMAGAARLIAPGPYVRDHALARFRNRVTIVPPGVDGTRFTPADADGAPGSVPASGTWGPNILFAAPLDGSYRWKGVDVLCSAFARVRATFPKATLTLVGAGDRLAQFQRRAEHDPGLRVLGRLPDSRLVDEYRRAGVVVAPSTSDAESFGMVLAEANACGRPVVGSDIGGIPDFVRPGHNGLLARPGDAVDLAQKVVDVLSNETAASAMGARGRQQVLRHHDWRELTRRTEHTLEQAVAHDPAGR